MKSIPNALPSVCCVGEGEQQYCVRLPFRNLFLDNAEPSTFLAPTPRTPRGIGHCQSWSSRQNPKQERRATGRKQAFGTHAFLLPFKHKDVRLTLADGAHGSGQRSEIGGKLGLLGSRDLAIDLVGDFQNVLVHPSR